MFSDRPREGQARGFGPGWWLYLLCLALVVVTAGCSVTGVRQRSLKAREIYNSSPAFNRADLFRDGVTVMHPRLNVGQEAFGQVFLQGLYDSLERYGSSAGDTSAGLIHPYRASRMISRHDLTKQYAILVDTYDETGILRVDILEKICSAVGVRYMAIPILINFQEHESPRLTPFGFRMINTASATARFQLQVWDRQRQKVVWEATSDLTIARDTFREDPIKFSEIANETWDTLLEKLPVREEASKSPDNGDSTS